MKSRTTVNQQTVRPSILVSIALQNLVSKKLRSGLTVFGIAVGIGAVYFLLSFGLGLQQVVSTQVIGNQSIKTIDVNIFNSRVVKLDDVTAERIRNMKNVESIGKVYYFPGSYKLDKSESDAVVYGIDDGYEKLTSLSLTHGIPLSKATSANSAILNTSALKAIGLSDKPGDMLKKTISLTIPNNKINGKGGAYTQEFTVVGIIDSGAGSEVFVPGQIFHDLGATSLTQLKVGVKDVTDVPTARTQIESLGLETVSPVDTLQQINIIFHYFNLILAGFGSIGMLIAIIGMFNTLTISLLERTKEIGLMVALGGRSIDMRLLFILEALLLSIVGTIAGVGGAILLGAGVNVVMNLFARSRGVPESFSLFSHTWWLFLGVLLFMILVGLAVAIMPARRAESINPIDALRHE